MAAAPRGLVPLASAADIRAVVDRMAEEISAAHPDGVLLVGVLKGGICFLADLCRRMRVPVEVDFLAVSPYTPGSGRVRLVKDLDADINGRAVVLVEDLIDTGLTARYLLAELQGRGPARLEVATLLDKPTRRIVPLPLDHVGMEVPDVFVLGYGLDFAGRYRNVADLWGGDAASLAAEPDCYLLDVYPLSGPAG